MRGRGIRIAVGLAPHRGAPRWSPLSPGLALAAWFETSTTSCFTDTAGLTPVTSDGDLVAAIRGNDGSIIAIQSGASGTRPIYRTGGGRPYLEFDGSRFLASSSPISVTDGSGQHSAVAATYFSNNTGVQSVIDADDLSFSRVSQLLRNNAGALEVIAFNTAVGTATDSGGSITAATPVVVSEITTGTTTESFISGTGSGGSTGTSGTPQSGTARLTIGSFDAGGGSFLTGRVYGFAVWQGALDSTNHASAVCYFQALYASLPDISGSSTLAFAGSGTILGQGAVAGSSSLTLSPSATLLGAGAVSGSASLLLSPSGTVAGHGPVAGSSTIVLSPSATLLGSGAVSGSSSILLSPSATLLGQGAISGSAALTLAGSGAISGTGQLLGSTALSFSLSGSLGQTGGIQGAAGISFDASAALLGTGQINGSASFSLTLAGVLVAGGAAAGRVKVWNGAANEPKPVKVWDGTAWVAKPLKRWTGTAWQATSY